MCVYVCVVREKDKFNLRKILIGDITRKKRALYNMAYI